MSMHADMFSDLAIWKIKYPISPLLCDKVRAKAFQTLPVVFAWCQCPLNEASFTHRHIEPGVSGRQTGAAVTKCVCALPVLCTNPNFTGNPHRDPTVIAGLIPAVISHS